VTVTAGVHALVDDLAAEQNELQALLRGVPADDWWRPTPSWGWDVRDTIAHLADTDEMAIDTMTAGDGSLSARSQRAASGEDVTFRGVLRGRKRTGDDVLAWWSDSATRVRATLTALDPDERVPWGLGMKPPSLASARLMETWAHGLDVRAALGVETVDTDRLAHVAWLATRALPYAYSVAGREPPPGTLRVELTLPSGARWTTGPEDAAGSIEGSASEYCRVFVHRLAPEDAPGLRATGDVAIAALEVARAYL
jgi:uncharacterized protein (TIGR03084 family)